MKPFKGSVIHAVRDYWRNLMSSVKESKISHGAKEVMKMITRAHKDNWRRKDHDKKPSGHDKK